MVKHRDTREEYAARVFPNLAWHATKPASAGDFRADYFTASLALLKEKACPDTWRMWLYGA